MALRLDHIHQKHLLVALGSDKERPLPTPALDMPIIKSMSTKKDFNYSTQVGMTVEHQATEIVDLYEMCFQRMGAGISAGAFVIYLAASVQSSVLLLLNIPL